MSHYNVAWGNRAFAPCFYYEFPAFTMSSPQRCKSSTGWMFVACEGVVSVRISHWLGDFGRWTACERINIQPVDVCGVWGWAERPYFSSGWMFLIADWPGSEKIIQSLGNLGCWPRKSGELKESEESGELKESEESKESGEQKSPLREQRALRYRGGRNHFSLSARRLRAATISSSAFAAPVQ